MEIVRVIMELIELAKGMQGGHMRGEKLGLPENERAFMMTCKSAIALQNKSPGRLDSLANPQGFFEQLRGMSWLRR